MGPIRRQHEIAALGEDEQCDGKKGHDRVNDSPREEEAESVAKVINRLEKELADIPVLDVGGNLPVVLADGGQGIDDGHHQVIGDHLGQAVTGDVLLLARENGPPQGDGGEERDQPDHAAKKKIEPVDQRVLDADVDHMPILFHTQAGGCLSPD